MPCPGGSTCPTGSTCCPLSDKPNDYGCCPLPSAVCCSDHLHCCPEGYTCDVEEGRCNRGEISLPFYTKISAVKNEKSLIEIKKEKNICPGGDAECPEESTCCQLESGEWGCCPMKNAVCCSDHLHCCPEGYTCDVQKGRCNKGDTSFPFFKKGSSLPVPQETQAKSLEIGSVVCPDGCSFCPNGYTCCKMATGSYGCCPLPNAVCCKDNIHCCPQGTTCNLEKQACDSQVVFGDSVEWSVKQPVTKVLKVNEPKVAQDPVQCPDNSTCDPLDICCELADNSFGCCPYTDGVCCKELSFCCPANTECGNSVGECRPKKIESRAFRTNWHTIEELAEKIGSAQKFPSLSDFVCPGGETSCSPNSTCCEKADGNFACCPYKNGTCCGSHGYCCPHGYTCDAKLEACTLNEPDLKLKPTKLKRFKKDLNFLLQMNPSIKNSAECEDSLHYCPDSFTCCSANVDGVISFGCCPVKDGTCCNDGINW